MDTSLALWALVSAALAILVLAALGLRAGHKVRNLTGFFILEEPLKHPGVLATLASTNTALALIVFWFAYLGWLYGLGVVIWLTLFWVLGLEVFAWWSRKCADFPGEADTQSDSPPQPKYQTLNEFIGDRHGGDRARRALAVASIFTLLLMANVELCRGMKILALVNEPIGVSIETLGFVILISVAVYAALGGFKAIVYTDYVQWPLAAAALIIALIHVFGGEQRLGLNLFHDPESGTFSIASILILPREPLFIIGSMFSWSAWFLVTMDMWQRCAAARTIRIINKRARLVLYPWFFFVTFSSAAIGRFVRVFDPEFQAFPVVRFLEMTSVELNWVGTVGWCMMFVGFLAAMMSTIDTYFVVIAHSAFRDLPSGEAIRSWPGRSVNRLLVAVGTLGLAVAGYPVYIALEQSGLDMNILLYLATTLPFVLLPAVVFGGTRKMCGQSAVVCGVGTGIVATAIYIGWIVKNIHQATEAANYAAIPEWYDRMYLAPALVAATACLGHVIAFKWSQRNVAL